MKPAKINIRYVYEIVRGKSRRYYTNIFKFKGDPFRIVPDVVRSEELLVRRSACHILLVPIQMGRISFKFKMADFYWKLSDNSRFG